MAIRFFDMFAGIGGFRSGLEQLGGFECVGYCEIDKYTKQAYEALYNTEGELYFDDARTIDPKSLPNIDLICGGFPCQSFSIAGLRRGFKDDTRGTLFFEIARIAATCRPPFLLLENVPGLLSHDKGRTFATILSTLDELGYDVAWQVLNSKNFGVPQSRKRVYVIGYLRGRCAGEILSFTQANETPPIRLIPGSEGRRVYSEDGVGITLTSGGGGFGGNTGLYDVSTPLRPPNTENITLSPTKTKGYYFIDLNTEPKLTETARCITARQDSGISKHKGEHSGIFIEDEPRAIITPDKPHPRQQGRRIKEPNEAMYTITVQDRHGILRYGRVRKLTPRECLRLQGFTDEQINKIAATGVKDGRMYKMAGNAVSVPVVTAVGSIIKRIYSEQIGEL